VYIYEGKKWVELSLRLNKHYAMEAFGRKKVRLHAFLTLGTRQKGVASFIFQPLCSPRNRPWYTLVRRLSGPRASLNIVAINKILDGKQNFTFITIIISLLNKFCFT